MDLLGDLLEQAKRLIVRRLGVTDALLQIGDAVLLGLQLAVVVGTRFVVRPITGFMRYGQYTTISPEPDFDTYGLFSANLRLINRKLI